MVDNRPLKKVPTRALYALHRGIERQPGLTTGEYRDHIGVCALGSLGDMSCKNQVAFEIGVAQAIEGLELYDPMKNYGEQMSVQPTHWIFTLNDGFNGSPEERREFMLRHIVSELSVRKLKLPEEKKLGGNSPRQPQREVVKA